MQILSIWSVKDEQLLSLHHSGPTSAGTSQQGLHPCMNQDHTILSNLVFGQMPVPIMVGKTHQLTNQTANQYQKKIQVENLHNNLS